MDRDRRRYLGLLAGALAGTAGCLGDGNGDDPTPTAEGAGDPAGDDPTATSTGTARATPTAAGSPAATDGSVATDGATAADGGTATAPGTTPAPSLVLDPVEPSGDAALTVYPRKLASMLRSAATGDGPVRATADAAVYAPEPLLPTVDAVEIVDPAGDADGTYAVACEGGADHGMTLVADEVPAEEATDPAPVSEFPAEYRDLVVEALTEPSAGPVSPETERGEWVREQFFGEYVSYEGQTYRGREVHPTDAVFFSTEVWYVLALSPVEGADDPLRLRLPEIDSAVRRTVDGALEERSKHDRAPAVAGPPLADAVRSFAADTDRVLTHTHAYEVALRP
ncbi:hypothetical protein [Halosimplex marinum]|uniref:hypothetical protein n=1 Tax=Halosimplex marinum TaxID=3396620 RepID=UPI003F548AF0